MMALAFNYHDRLFKTEETKNVMVFWQSSVVPVVSNLKMGDRNILLAIWRYLELDLKVITLSTNALNGSSA